MRVLTWNLWWRFGDHEARQPAIRAHLLDRDPDVVMLQEVHGDAAGNQAADLADALGGYDHVWSPASQLDSWGGRALHPDVDIGIAILSRWPIVARDELVLEVDQHEDRGRTAVHALIDAPGGAVPVFTTHLPSRPTASALRCDMVRALVPWLREHERDHAHPPILGGDLNAEDDSDEIRLLGGLKTAGPVPGYGLLDAWRYAPHGRPGATWDQRNPYVATTPTFDARIDYVFVGRPGADGRGIVEDVRVVANTPIDGQWASDHAAVQVDLTDPATT